MNSKKASTFVRYNFLINDFEVLKILEWLNVFIDKVNIILTTAYWHLNDRNDDECK